MKCGNCESETFQCSACGCLLEPWGSAVPQPVDREALSLEQIEQAARDAMLARYPQSARLARDMAAVVAPAVLAMLAGEQEQVEP